MERSEAEAVYDVGREACVEFLLELTARYEREIARLKERVARLEEESRKDSSNSSSPPSRDPPASRAERRAAAREKAKQWAKRDGEKRKAGASLGTRALLASSWERISSMRSSSARPYVVGRPLG